MRLILSLVAIVSVIFWVALVFAATRKGGPL